MIDLCIDARMAYSSGIGVYIRQLVPYLNAPPFRVILLVSKQGEPWCQKIEQIECKAPVYSIQEQIQLPLRIPRCDIFWSPHYNVPIPPIRAKKRAVTIHDVCHIVLPQYLSFPARIYSRLLMKYAIDHSEIIFTVSEFSKNELIQFFQTSHQKIQAIPNAIDKQLFQRMENATHLLKKYRISEKFILYVGNLKSHKNIKGLLTAFSHITHLNLQLIIVGKKNDLRNSIQTIDQKNVVWLENVPEEDLPGLYSLAQLFVLPSFYEGFGFTPLEAMACGCPAIVSHAASLPEVCRDACFYIDPHRPETMAAAIENIVKNPTLKMRLIQKGTERLSCFSWPQSAKHYRERLKKLVAT